MRYLSIALLVCGVAFGAQVPRPAPELIVKVPGGQTESVSSQKGNVVVVAFISTTCPHCQNSARLLSKLNSEYSGKGLRIYMLAINDNADAAAFTRQYGVTFPVGTATRDVAYGYLQHPMMAANFYVPQVVFIDRQGTIRGQYGGSDAFLMTNEEANFRGMIEKLLAEGGSKSSGQGAKKAVKRG